VKPRIYALTALALLLVAAVAGTASAKQAAPKPGFLPGTWVGTGTIKGSVEDGPMWTTFSGGIAFTLKVDKTFRASGSGSWKMNMLGTQDEMSEDAIDSSMFGTASLRLSGSATNVAFKGLMHVVGEIRAYGHKRPMKPFDQEIAKRLVITKATTCKVSGTTQIQPGVTLTWSAKRKGPC
jgi:hypothetical protein